MMSIMSIIKEWLDGWTVGRLGRSHLHIYDTPCFATLDKKTFLLKASFSTWAPGIAPIDPPSGSQEPRPLPRATSAYSPAIV